MSRNKYDDAFGVARLRWHLGEPIPSRRPVLCEVWRASTSIDAYEATKPQVKIVATIEVRVHDTAKWFTIGLYGMRAESETGEVRRHAFLPSRTWRKTIAIDGWDE